MQSSLDRLQASPKLASGPRNIRNSELSPEREIGPKDCGMCVRRRIRCDRSSPACRKCESRSLQCPGYDARLKWNQGVASRGKLKGKSQPILGTDAYERRSQVEHGPDSMLGGQTLIRCPVADLAKSHDDVAQARFVTATLEIAHSLNQRAISTSLLSYLEAHYQDQVAPRLQWVDAPANPWKTIMPSLLPLSRALQFAVLNISATHLSVTSMARSAESRTVRDLTHNLRMMATKSLREQITQELAEHPKHRDRRATSVIVIIATTMVLCHSEMLTPDSTDWTLHLRACREVCSQECRSNGLPRSVHPIMEFFKKALSDLEIFQSTSSFSREYDVLDPVLTELTPRDRSWFFMTVVREVTLTERLRHTHSIQNFANSDVNLPFWEGKMSRARALAFSHPLLVQNGEQHLQQQFRRVVLAHYYAGLIYIHQALSQECEDSSKVRLWTDGLSSELQSILACEWRNFDHDLFWPMFIAGSQAKSDVCRQATVERNYQRLMDSTGFWCNAKALTFLQAFWETDHTLHKTWIHYARGRESGSEPFLIY